MQKKKEKGKGEKEGNSSEEKRNLRGCINELFIWFTVLCFASVTYFILCDSQEMCGQERSIRESV